MAKILDFKPVKKKSNKSTKSVAPTTTDAQKLMQIANEIDALILQHLKMSGVDPIDVAGVLAHRLGTLLSHLEEKNKLWNVCERVLKKQAKLDAI